MFISQNGITQLLIFVMVLFFLSLSYVLYLYLRYKNNLLNFLVVDKFRKIKWSDSHIGSPRSMWSKRSHLGAGGIYYGIVQSSYSNVAVVIGSGAGFVPKIIAQAQRDTGMKNACTYYIDADINVINPSTGQEYGQPKLDKVVLDKNLFLLKMRSSYAAKLFEKEKIKIDYLHIDGDHSVKGILEDWYYFHSLLSHNAIITFHDYSSVPDVKIALDKIKESYPQIQIIVLPNIAAGIAMAQLCSKEKIINNKENQNPKLSYFRNNKTNTLVMEDVFLIPESGSKLKTLSHWGDSLEPQFQERYKIAAEYLNDSKNIIEISGFPNSMVYFAPKVLKTISVVEPFATNNWTKQVYLESLSKKINLDIYPGILDVNIESTIDYDLVWLGLGLSYFNEDQIIKLLKIIAGSKRAVVEHPNYEHSIRAWEFIVALLGPKITKIQECQINTDSTKYSFRKLYFIDGFNPIDDYLNLNNIRNFQKMLPIVESPYS